MQKLKEKKIHVYEDKSGFKYTIKATLDTTLYSVFYKSPHKEGWYKVLVAPLLHDLDELNKWFTNYAKRKNMKLIK